MKCVMILEGFAIESRIDGSYRWYSADHRAREIPDDVAEHAIAKGYAQWPEDFLLAQLERLELQDQLRRRESYYLSLQDIGLSNSEVDQQRKFDRLMSVLRARRAGATLAEIGLKIGRSCERVRQIQHEAERLERCPVRNGKHQSPLVELCADQPIAAALSWQELAAAKRHVPKSELIAVLAEPYAAAMALALAA